MTRFSRICATIAAAALATGCATHGASKASAAVATPDNGSAAPGAPPISGALGITPGDGPPGTVISLHAERCPPHGSKPDEILWQDSSYPTKPGKLNKGGDQVMGIVRTGDELDATFTMPPSAPAGVGTFLTYCGAKPTGALAEFTVDAP